jgi:hypothetical protein
LLRNKFIIYDIPNKATKFDNGIIQFYNDLRHKMTKCSLHFLRIHHVCVFCYQKESHFSKLPRINDNDDNFGNCLKLGEFNSKSAK